MGMPKGSSAPNRIDLTGHRFGKLLVTGETETRGKIIFWKAQCDCGGTVFRRSQQYRVGGATHCGCTPKPPWNKQGRKGTPAYQSWLGMKNRCSNLKNKDYGGKGITVCDRWIHSFETFLQDMGEPPAGMSIDRINNSKGYSPENCRWATRNEQVQNRSVARTFEWNGRMLNLAELARQTKIKYATLYRRLVTSGWPIEQAVAQRVGARGGWAVEEF